MLSPTASPAALSTSKLRLPTCTNGVVMLVRGARLGPGAGARPEHHHRALVRDVAGGEQDGGRGGVLALARAAQHHAALVHPQRAGDLVAAGRQHQRPPDAAGVRRARAHHVQRLLDAGGVVAGGGVQARHLGHLGDRLLAVAVAGVAEVGDAVLARRRPRRPACRPGSRRGPTATVRRRPGADTTCRTRAGPRGCRPRPRLRPTHRRRSSRRRPSLPRPARHLNRRCPRFRRRPPSRPSRRPPSRRRLPSRPRRPVPRVHRRPRGRH